MIISQLVTDKKQMSRHDLKEILGEIEILNKNVEEKYRINPKEAK